MLRAPVALAFPLVSVCTRLSTRFRAARMFRRLCIHLADGILKERQRGAPILNLPN